MLIHFAAMWIRLIAILLTVPAGFSWEVKTSGVDTNLRGLSVFALDKNGSEVVWASGSNATVLRSGNSGADWERITVPDSAGLDFRGVQVVAATISLYVRGNVRRYIQAETVYVMSSGDGDTWRIYKTDRKS